jgi:outer membrane protein OmpA-like peptidoglycan-associated protein
MQRPTRATYALLCALPLLAAVLAAPAPAAADTQIGGWFGPRVFSSDSKLGYIPEQPYRGLANAISFGPRLAYPLEWWLVPEIELGFAPARAEPMSVVDQPARVFWLEPRLHIRFELMPGRRVQPFVLAGGGTPIALSTRTREFDTTIIGSGYLGGGVRFDTQKGFMIRVDARVAFLPAIESFIAPEVDIGFGIEFALGKPRARTTGERSAARGPRPDDRDDDGVPDAQDGCPDRPEDAAGFEDGDGCPDIDNDLDRVLDIADKCAGVPETYNGFQDDDGCPDTLPLEVDGLKGTVEGLLYAEGETMVRGAAQSSIARIAKVMAAHPSIRVVLIGHTDDREAKQFATTDGIEIEIEGEGEPAAGGAPPPAPDLAALSADLSRARAEAVKQAIAAQGIAGPRIDVEGHGAEEPVSDNDKPRGRLANRRVEIKLYVPPSGLSR